MPQSYAGFQKCLLLRVLSVILLLGLSGSVVAQDVELRTLFCPIISEAPTIDGVVNEDEWSESTTIDSLTRPGRWREVAEAATSSNIVTDTPIKIMADESTLYVAFVCGGPDGKLKDPKKRERDGVAATDNIVQVFVDLDHDHKTNKMFAVDYSGAQADAANAGTGHKGGNDISWNGDWQSAVGRGESSWSVEMAIPVRDLTGTRIAPGTTFGINFLRRRPDLAYNAYMVTSPLAISRFYWSHIFADVVCGPPSVVVSKIDLPVWRQGRNTVGLELRNYGETTEAVEIAARASSIAGGEEWETKSLTLEPGGMARAELTGRVVGDWENKFDLKLTRAQTGEQLYTATYSKLNFGAPNLLFAPKEAMDEQGHTWDIKTSVNVRLQPDPYTVELAPTQGATGGGEVRVRTELKAQDSGELIRAEEYNLLPGSKVRADADTSGLSDGSYVLSIAIAQESRAELLDTAHYSICAGREFGGLKAGLAQLHESIARHPERAESLHFARSSFLMLEYLVQEAERVIDTGTITGVYSTDAFRKNLATAQDFLREAVKRAEVFAQDRDPLAGQRGVIQRAYVSSFHREIRPYTVFVPSTYDGSKPYPLISYMLSGGPTPDWRSSSDEQGRVRSGSLALAEEKGFIMVWPTARRLQAEANFFDVLEQMKKDYNIDPDRIYLMGVSGGGLASWTIGLLHPDQIAAICPISSVTITAGGPDDMRTRWRAHILSEERAALPTEAPGQESQVVVKARSTYYYPMNALHLPVMILHSDADTSTLVDVQARPMVKKMRELGLDVEYVEYPGVGHGLGHYYADGFARALAFFDKHRNVRHPKTIDYSTPSIRYNKAYWIRIGKFAENGKFARVQAEAKGSTVEVKTENITGFSVLRDAEVFDVSAPVKVIIDGQRVFEGMFPETGGPAFVRGEDGVWQAR